MRRRTRERENKSTCKREKDYFVEMGVAQIIKGVAYNNKGVTLF